MKISFIFKKKFLHEDNITRMLKLISNQEKNNTLNPANIFYVIMNITSSLPFLSIKINTQKIQR